MTRIAVLDDYQQVALGMADWQSLPGAEVVSFRDALRGQALVQSLADFDIVVAMRERTAFTAALIAQLPKLRLIATTGLRNAAIDLAACQRAGITVTGARGAKNGRAVTAETAWALILALHKRLVASHLAIGQGRWQPELGLPLAGRVMGIVGLGHIGRHMARVATAFGMEVIAWSPHLSDEIAAQAGARRVEKHTLFATSDVVSLHLVLSAATAGVVAAPEIDAMQAHAFLVNTARAGLVDEAALMAALQARRLGGAGLDVFWEEPLSPTHRLCTLPNVVLSPHMGYVTEENLGAYYRDVVAQHPALVGWQGTHAADLSRAGITRLRHHKKETSVFKKSSAAVVLAFSTSALLAQSWPSQPIKYIVPFPPGGATDLISRPLADRLRQRLGQPVLIDNIPGAGASIGTAQLKQAKPDGYTIALGNSASHTITPHLLAKPPCGAGRWHCRDLGR